LGLAQTFSTASATIDLRLPGQWTELETNSLSQNRYRDYSPSIGRYAQADPIGINAGPNVYSYAADDPYDGVDPKGLDSAVLAAPAGAFFGVDIGGAIGAFFATVAPPVILSAPLLLYGDTPRPNVTNIKDRIKRNEFCPLLDEIPCPIPGNKRGLYLCPDASRRYFDIDVSIIDKPLPPYIHPTAGFPMGIR